MPTDLNGLESSQQPAVSSLLLVVCWEIEPALSNLASQLVVRRVEEFLEILEVTAAQTG